ncbi:MAG: murein biosynthesis integral membrane protein MurJ [Acidimicrobiia bacterium]|nr:MAG: murein biosynthesis integral membrane protein MurJ [Acidimicrobiia bacterium]
MAFVQTFMKRLRRGDVGAAAIIVAGGILLSRILGILRDMIFAWMLGADGITDQYVAAFRIPDFANYLLAGGFLTITFIPIFAKYIADDDEDAGWIGFTAILRWLALGIAALIAIAWVATPSLVSWLYPNFTADQVDSTIQLTRIVLPAQFAFVVGSMFAAVQYAKGVFTIPTLAPVIYNLGIISGGIAYALVTGEPDPAGFIWGALFGAFIGNFALQIWGARRVGMKLDMSAPWKHRAVIAYIVIAFPLMLGQSVVALDELFMSVFGGMVAEGTQTYLQFARRTMFVPIGVIAQAAAVAAYPTLARLFAEGNRAALLATVDKAMRYVLVLSIGAAGIVAAMSLPAIRILFERGSFTADDTDAASAALFMYAFGIPVWGGLQIITRAFYAKKEMWTPVIVGTATTILAVPLYFVMQSSFGIEGVAITSVLTLGAYTAVLMGIWYRPPDARVGLRSMLEGAGRAIPLAVPAAFTAGAVSWAISTGIQGSPLISATLALLVGGAVYTAVALGIGALLYDRLTKPVPPSGPFAT